MKDTGVIVGRFQVNDLHEGHIRLIEGVLEKHAKLIIFLGVSPCKCTMNNPLDFEARKQMIQAKFPDVIVLYIADEFSDVVWSAEIDKQIEYIKSPQHKAILYGSRDSFVKHYHGKYDCIELEDVKSSPTGTETRDELGAKAKASPDFRAGVIWATHNQYPKPIPTVDVVIFNNDRTKVLLGRKPNETRFRFIGGFVNPNETFKQSAKREAYEETQLELDNFEYIDNLLIDDWRYQSEIDKIITTVFSCDIVYGSPTPSDDIVELKFFKLKDITNNIIAIHLPIVDLLF